MKNQKGFMMILIVLIVVAALGVVGFTLYTQQQNALSLKGVYNPSNVPSQYQNQYKQSGESVTSIKSTTDLNTTAKTLDNTDTTQLDTQLNKLNSSASSF